MLAVSLAQAAAQRVPEITVRGSVLAYESTQPILGARVQLTVELPWQHPAATTFRQPPAAVTDVHGEFRITCAPPAGSLAIRVEADGRVPTEDFLLPLASADLGRILLKRGILLRGRVVDDRGSPVEGLRLRQPTGLSIRKMFGVYASALTARDGSFVFDSPLPAGGVLPAIENDGFTMLSERFEIGHTGAVSDCKLQVARRPSIAGVVFSPAGRPLPGVDVRAEDDEAPSRTKTLADGSFVLFAHPTAAASVALRLGGAGALTTYLAPPIAWGRAGLEFEVAAPASLPLVVVEQPGGTPVERYGVYVRSYQSDALPDTRLQHTGQRHRNGRLELAALRQGRNRVLVVPHDHALVPAECFLDVDGSPLPELRLELERMQPVAVRIVDRNGLPLRVDVDVLDLRGTDQVRTFEDLRCHRFCWPDDPCAIRLSCARADHDGRAELLLPAPRDQVEIVVRGPRDQRLPLRERPPRDQELWLQIDAGLPANGR